MSEATKFTAAESNPRSQIYSIFREALWVSTIACFITVLLYLPDQIRELYRINISENGWVGYALIAVPVHAISLIVWFGAKLVTTDCLQRIERPRRLTSWVADTWPAVLGALPVLAMAGGLYFALPSFGVVGLDHSNQLDNYSSEVLAEFRQLETFALVSLALALAVLVVGYVMSRVSTAKMAQAGDSYFRRWHLLPVSVGMIAAATLAFFYYPVLVASTLGVFGMLTVFMASIVGMTAHLTVLSREHNWPLVAIPLALAFAFSVFDLNDNHEVRRLPAVTEKTAQTIHSRQAPHADEEFLAWYEHRPGLAVHQGAYPVYVVAAQGGGIYAAYQTAIFLARMQDVCPLFKNHLFAISSVSGGSLGAAIFTAALRTVEQQALATPAKPQPAATAQPAADPQAASPGSASSGEASSGRAFGACPAIDASHINGAMAPLAQLEAPGPHETVVRRMLSADLLSPLVGATLFTDFTQRFLPYPFGDLDRARVLEASFEAAASPTGRAGSGPLAESFLSHWRPTENRGPALLLNATDAATGKRVIIAPFAVRASGSPHGQGAVAHFPFWRETETGVRIAEPINIRLSTAAGISARFPWMTPAATVTVVDAKTNRRQSVRLVDGGYVDNSGAETALDLLRSLETMSDKIALVAGTGTRSDGGPRLRPVKFHLIALSGGDYPLRTSFSLGESLEPIRALLSARTSRAYSALDLARLELGTDAIASLSIGQDRVVPVTTDRLRVAKLASRFYELPLGWSLGSRTRDIIERQSGRFWECELNEKLEQRSTSGAQADCIQMIVYHQLTQTLDAAVKSIDRSSRMRGRLDVQRGTRLDNQAFLACYSATRGRTLTETQERALGGLLKIWDGRPEWSDDRWLAFILGFVAHETNSFNIKEESFKYSASGMQRVWPRHFPTEADTAEYVGQPEKLANKVYANVGGNREAGDGYRYRGRGMVQLTGRENYRRYGRLVGAELEALPELLLDPEIGARVAFAQIFPLGTVNRLANFFTAEKEDWAEARRSLTGGFNGLADFMEQKKVFLGCIQQTKRH